jgi:hypothetical protein
MTQAFNVEKPRQQSEEKKHRHQLAKFHYVYMWCVYKHRGLSYESIKFMSNYMTQRYYF